MKPDRKVILFIAVSLDGYIAKKGDDLSFLSIVEKEGEDYGYSSFIKNVDTVILGRRTYDWICSKVPVFPHIDKETYVITKTARPAAGNIRFYSDNILTLVSQLRNQPGKNIFIDGGAAIVNLLLGNRLIDELYLNIIPVLLGDGIRLFKEGGPEQILQLVQVKNFDSGLVQLHYKIG